MVRRPSLNRLVQTFMFPVDCGVRRISDEERIAFVLVRRPDGSAIDEGCETDVSRRGYNSLLSEVGDDVIVEELVYDDSVRSLIGVTDIMFLYGLRGTEEVPDGKPEGSPARTHD